jgi:hypothetical protein
LLNLGVEMATDDTFGSKAGTAVGKGVGKPAQILLHSNRVITAGFIVCGLIVAVEAMTGTDKASNVDDKNWGDHFMMREVAVCVVFLVLGIVSTIGKNGGKIASGLAILVTVATLFNSAKAVAFIAKDIDNIESNVSDAASSATSTQAPVAGIPEPNTLSSEPGGVEGAASAVATGTTPGTIMTGNGGQGTSTGLSNPAAGGGAPY